MLRGCCRTVPVHLLLCGGAGEAQLALVPEAAGDLCLAYLLGVVAEREARDGGGAGAAIEGMGGREGSQMLPRGTRTQLLQAPVPASLCLCVISCCLAFIILFRLCCAMKIVPPVSRSTYKVSTLHK